MAGRVAGEGEAPVFRRGCKPNSVCPAMARERAICLSGRYPAPACRSRLGTGRSKAPYLALLPGRFSMPRRLRAGRWALTPPFHPCHSPCEPWRYLLCGTVCRGELWPAAPACIPGRAGVTRPRALWSSDFPPVAMPRATLRPSGTLETLPGSDFAPSGFLDGTLLEGGRLWRGRIREDHESCHVSRAGFGR